jgi:alpha-L-rhamnosidase
MCERWNCYTKVDGFGPVGMNSFNHFANGAIGEWIYEVFGGICPLSPGYGNILFAPEPGDGITSARTELDAPTGYRLPLADQTESSHHQG